MYSGLPSTSPPIPDESPQATESNGITSEGLLSTSTHTHTHTHTSTSPSTPSIPHISPEGMHALMQQLISIAAANQQQQQYAYPSPQPSPLPSSVSIPEGSCTNGTVSASGNMIPSVSQAGSVASEGSHVPFSPASSQLVMSPEMLQQTVVLLQQHLAGGLRTGSLTGSDTNSVQERKKEKRDKKEKKKAKREKEERKRAKEAKDYDKSNKSGSSNGGTSTGIVASEDDVVVLHKRVGRPKKCLNGASSPSQSLSNNNDKETVGVDDVSPSVSKGITYAQMLRDGHSEDSIPLALMPHIATMTMEVLKEEELRATKGLAVLNQEEREHEMESKEDDDNNTSNNKNNKVGKAAPAARSSHPQGRILGNKGPPIGTKSLACFGFKACPTSSTAILSLTPPSPPSGWTLTPHKDSLSPLQTVEGVPAASYGGTSCSPEDRTSRTSPNGAITITSTLFTSAPNILVKDQLFKPFQETERRQVPSRLKYWERVPPRQASPKAISQDTAVSVFVSDDTSGAGTSSVIVNSTNDPITHRSTIVTKVIRKARSDNNGVDTNTSSIIDIPATRWLIPSSLVPSFIPMSVDTSNRELFSNTTSSQQQQQHTSTFFYPYDEAHYLVRILESDPLAFMAYTSTSGEECVREKGGPEEEDVMYINTSGETHSENEVKDIYNNNNNNDDNCAGPSTTTATNNEFSREVIFSGFYSIGYKPYEVRPSYFGTSNNRGMYEREKENYFLQQQRANKNKRDTVDNLGDDIDYYGNNEEKGSDDDEYHLVLSPNDLARTPLGLEFGYLKTVDYTDSADDWESEPSDGEDVMGGDGEEDEELDFSDDDDMTSFIDDEEGCIFRAPGTSGVNNNDEIIDDEVVEQKAMDKRRERQMRLIKQGRLVPQAKGPFGNLSLLDHPFHLNWDFIEQEVIQDTCSESSERAASIAVTKVSKTSDNRTNKCVDATADIEVVESRNREELLKHHIKQWTSCNKRGRLTTFAVDLFPRLLEKQLFQTGLATKDNISEVLLAKAEIVKDECAILDKIVKNLSEDDSTIVTSDGLTRRELAERKATIDYLRYGAPFTDEHLTKLKEQAPCTGTFQPVERQPPEEGHVSADDSPIGATALPPAAVCKTYKYYETMNQLRAKAFEVCSDVPRNKLDSNLKDHFVRFKGQWRSKDSIDPQEIEEKEREDMELCLRERERDEKFKLASIPYTDAEVLIIKEKLSQSRLLLSKMDLCQAILDCFTVVNEEDFDRDKNSNSRNNSQNRVSSVSQSVDPKDDDNESKDIRANMGLDVLRTNEDIQMTKPSSLGSTGESPTLSPQPTSRMVSLISRCFNIPASPRSISPSSQGAVLGWDGVSPRQYHTYNNRSASPINLSSQSKRKYIPRRVQEVIDQHFIKLGRFWRVKDSVTAEELAADEVRKSKISEGKEKERILIEEKRKLTIESCKAFGLWSNNNNNINNISNNNNNNQVETEEVVDDGGGCPGDVDMEVGVSSGESAAVGCKRSREEDTQGLQYKA